MCLEYEYTAIDHVQERDYSADSQHRLYRQYLAHSCGCVEGLVPGRSTKAGGQGQLWSLEQTLTVGTREFRAETPEKNAEAANLA